MKKLALVLAASLCLAFVGPGARAADEPPLVTGLGVNLKTTVKAKKRYVMACVVKNSTNPAMIMQLDGFKEAGRVMGFEALTLAPAKQDNIEEQVKIIEDLLQRGVQGIAIHPSDSNGVVPVLEKAVAMGLPVVAIGTPANTDRIMMRTGVDYRDSGFVIAQAVANRLEGKGGVIVLSGPPQAINSNERVEGIKAAVAKFPGVKILDVQPANFNRLMANQVMENLLQRFPKIDGVIAANDEMALGAIQALEAAGRLKGVVVSGFDGSPDASAAVKTGRLWATSPSDPRAGAFNAAAYMVQYLNEKKLPPKKFMPYPDTVQIVTRENIEPYLAETTWK